MILPRLPLSARIAFFVFLAELLLLGGLAATVYVLCRRQFVMSFDDSLRANVQAIAALLEWNRKTKRVEVELPDEALARFVEGSRPDLFAVLDLSGNAVERSPKLRDLPPWATHPQPDLKIGDLRYRDKAYRGILFPTRVKNEDRPTSPPMAVSVFFAANLHELGERLDEIKGILLWSVGILLALSGPLAWLVAWRGLWPLRGLAAETRRIRPASLHLRLGVDSLPRDLLPLAQAVNLLIARVEEAFERERQFSADAAHELRTPLATLKSGIQAALLSRRDPAADRAVLGELLDDVARLEKLCESLLLIASAEKPEDSVAMPVGEWADCVAALVEESRPVAEQAGCSLTFSAGPFAKHRLPADSGAMPSPPPHGPAVRADELATRRIVGNLIDNAIRHGGSGVSIHVRLEEDNGRPCLVVEDNGPGVAPEDEPRLFERFFRADRARSRATGGAGVGLAICRAVAESFGGSMRYERPPSGGSRFIWTLQPAA